MQAGVSPKGVSARMLRLWERGAPLTQHILIVDDEESIRVALQRLLEYNGFDARVAEDGFRALESLAEDPADVVLLDIKMPRISGFDVLKHIRQHHPGTKVVMLTGFADLKNAIESKKLGADDFVSKPYDLVDLLTTIERVLGE